MKQNDKIIYFFDSYYLMLDYDESLNQIVNEFITSESVETTNEIINQMNELLTIKKLQNENLNIIINECVEMSVKQEEMLEIIKEIYTEFKNIKQI